MVITYKRLIVVSLFAFSMLFNHIAGAVDIYVAPGGADANPGTASQPKATVASALRQARELRRLKDPSVKDGVRIIVKGGTYHLYEPIFVRPEDSGTETSPTVIEAASGERPILSGGVQIKGWKKASSTPYLSSAAQGKVWVADMPMFEGRPLEFRQLWINGQKAIRAKDTQGDSMNRILSWNHQTESCWIPRPKTGDLSSFKGLEKLK